MGSFTSNDETIKLVDEIERELFNAQPFSTDSDATDIFEKSAGDFIKVLGIVRNADLSLASNEISRCLYKELSDILDKLNALNNMDTGDVLPFVQGLEDKINVFKKSSLVFIMPYFKYNDEVFDFKHDAEIVFAEIKKLKSIYEIKIADKTSEPFFSLFNDMAKSANLRAWLWLVAMVVLIACSFISGLYFWNNLGSTADFISQYKGTPDNLQETLKWQYAISQIQHMVLRISALAVLVTLVFWAARNYKIAMHQHFIYKHKKLCLESIRHSEALKNAEEIRKMIAPECISAIYKLENSGFIDSHREEEPILKIYEKFTPRQIIPATPRSPK